jgi:hypothetical protein
VRIWSENGDKINVFSHEIDRLVSGASIQTEEGVLGENIDHNDDIINVFSHEIGFKNI